MLASIIILIFLIFTHLIFFCTVVNLCKRNYKSLVQVKSFKKKIDINGI